MLSIKKSLNPNSLVWTVAFAIVAGSFITGMTGYVTMGSNYPFVLITAIGINFILAHFIRNIAASREFSFYNRILNLFEGKLGQFFGSFAGMFILMALLFVGIGEGKTAALALRQVSFQDVSLEYFLILVFLVALIPCFMGLKKNLDMVFYVFAGLIALRTLFIVFFLSQSVELPAWSFDNMYNSVHLSDFQGDQGIVFIAFRLAFWSILAIEIFNLWKKSGARSVKKLRILFLSALVLAFTIIPGIYMAGVFPYELWQLIVLSDEGCFGACPSLALGYNFGGQAGLIIMATSSVLSHVLLVSLSFMLMSRVITNLARNQLFFGRMNKLNVHTGGKSNPYALMISFVLVVLLSMLNLSASYWVGLSLYMSFGLIMLVQVLCLLNVRYQWFNHKFLGSNTLCVLTFLSVSMMGILFYSGFKGQHSHFLNFAFAIFCFALWVAATSLVYVIKIDKE